MGNRHRTVSDDALSDFFTQSGFRVASVVVIHDKMTGESKGFGFAELAEREDLQGAMQWLNSEPLGGRPLTVKLASAPHWILRSSRRSPTRRSLRFQQVAP